MSTHAALQDSRRDEREPRELWSPLKISAAEIEAQLTALEEGGQDVRGRREAYIVHPQAPAGVRGLAPATQVALGVLLPGESTDLTRDNTTGLAMGIGGTGSVSIGDRTMPIEQNDVWTKPTMRLERFANTGTEPFRYLRYSNAALLESISAYYEDHGSEVDATDAGVLESGPRAKDLAPAIPLSGGAQLLPYEHLVNPDFVEDFPLHFAWSEVSQHLSGVLGLTTGYTGRPLVVLYNPATGRLNGTTPSFFATITAVGGEFIGGNHRHMSSAINYHFQGSGYSVVEGERYDWKAGDLMLSAPGWAQHQHFVSPEGARILTVQDHPLHTSNASLVWQEDIEKGEILILGSQAGFETNIADYAAR